MEIKGRVFSVGETQQVTETFKKRELILEYADNQTYPQYIKLEANQDKVTIFDGLVSGQEIEASVNLQGRLWTDKNGVTTAFNTLNVWKINKLGEAVQVAEVIDSVVTSDSDGDSLPF